MIKIDKKFEITKRYLEKGNKMTMWNAIISLKDFSLPTCIK